jgi:hypothetical protein
MAVVQRRAVARKDWRAARMIVLGWTLNWMILLGLVVIFSIYGCEFYAV